VLATIPAAANSYSASAGVTIASAHSIRSRFRGGAPHRGGSILVQHRTDRWLCWHLTHIRIDFNTPALAILRYRQELSISASVRGYLRAERKLYVLFFGTAALTGCGPRRGCRRKSSRRSARRRASPSQGSGLARRYMPSRAPLAEPTPPSAEAASVGTELGAVDYVLLRHRFPRRARRGFYKVTVYRAAHTSRQHC
jgi:hypothetical protein